ncbi:peptide deformylase [candidate division KSB1 bacterium]|nr:peptide deformylase [candidate division KSB1 bacterium]
MALLDVITYGHPTLRKVAKPVQKDQIDKLFIRDLLETMHERDGVGLAAPQVNVSQRIIVVTDFEHTFTMINPRVIAHSEGLLSEVEGCLSLPGFQAVVQRYARVIVSAWDENAETYEVKASGLLSRAIQHEIDHLNGVLYIDRADISTLARIDPITKNKNYISLPYLVSHFKNLNKELSSLVFESQPGYFI